MIDITLKDGSKRAFPKGTKVREIAENISPAFAKKVLIATSEGKPLTLDTPVHTSAPITFHTWDDDFGKQTFWHSSSHVMAEAVLHFFPQAKLGFGPPIENGFYYDVDLDDCGEELTEERIAEIEKKFLALAQLKMTFKRAEISKADALAYYRERENPYKVELIEGLKDGTITFYTQGNFTDLCKGPHIDHTGVVRAFKIMNVAGAYWRGDERNKMLTRLYAISFPSQKELDEYVASVEEAKKRDHRKIGKELGLFTFSEKVGMGLPLWLPKGALLRERLQEFLYRIQLDSGYEPVITPHIASKELYVTSGHYEKYGKDSFQPITTPREGEEFFLKPMNCPHHCEIYKSSRHSYKDLPVRYAEFGTVYRYEQHGELHGLTRVRGFTQDDAHLFCRPDQIKSEFAKVIDIVLYVFRVMGFAEYTAQISLRDPDDLSKYIGSDEHWAQAERAIMEIAEERGLPTQVVLGEAAFYGPKLDFMIKDALGRKWQLGTIQVDYNLPERFDLEYTDADNTTQRPVMLHRAPFGSLERFVAVLLEHTAGRLPAWLSPVQIAILPVVDKVYPYAKEVEKYFYAANLRVTSDERNEKVGKKIRDAELEKIPFMFIIGEKEAAAKSVSVRVHGRGDVGAMSWADALKIVKDETDLPAHGLTA